MRTTKKLKANESERSHTSGGQGPLGLYFPEAACSGERYHPPWHCGGQFGSQLNIKRQRTRVRVSLHVNSVGRRRITRAASRYPNSPTRVLCVSIWAASQDLWPVSQENHFPSPLHFYPPSPEKTMGFHARCRASIAVIGGGDFFARIIGKSGASGGWVVW